MGRLVSVVRRRAALKGSLVFFTQILRVSFHGLINATYWPSGESCAPVISGLPKSSSRSMSGGRPGEVEAVCWAISAPTTRPETQRSFQVSDIKKDEDSPG